ncbi:MAG TPA: acylphosphatase [Tepidisphaeraceae bacterium]|nr:acylphosphatase [Tepidisphaeraceae bacterium]
MKTLSPGSTRRLVHYAGRVQGVGFRCSVQNIALQYNIAGYVRNLPDGRVELLMEGVDSDLDKIAQRVAEKMAGFIQGTTIQTAPATGEFEQFTIRH